MKRIATPIVCLVFAALCIFGCTYARDFADPNGAHDRYVRMLERNGCPAESFNKDVFAQDCKLSDADEALIEQWRREAIPSNCASQYNCTAQFDQPCDPCWQREREREKTWDRDHHKESTRHLTAKKGTP